MAGEIIYQFSPVSLLAVLGTEAFSGAIRSRHRSYAREFGRSLYRYNERDMLLPNVAEPKRKRTEEFNGAAEARCFGLRAVLPTSPRLEPLGKNDYNPPTPSSKDSRQPNRHHRW